MKDELIRYLTSILEYSLSTIKNATDHPGTNEYRHFCNMVLKLNYSGHDSDGLPGPSAAEYGDPILGAYYLTRYGYLYAFEYWVIYDAILRNLGSDLPVLKVTTVGCGTMLDAWSLAYAKARILEDRAENENLKTNLNKLDLSYYGYDGAKWGLFLAGNEAHDSDRSISAEQRIVNKNFVSIPWINDFDAQGEGVDIADVFNKSGGPISDSSVIFFSRILNEISNIKLDQVVENIRQLAKNGDFKQIELYICISHSSSRQSFGFAKRIIDAINYNDQFTVEDDILRSSSLFGEYMGLEGVNYQDEDPYNYYSFELREGKFGPFGEKPGTLNCDFCKECLVNVMNSIDDFDETMKENNVREYKVRMKQVRYISMQVIKLTRKE